MRIQFIRHGTSLLDLGGKRILVDPMLSDAGAMPPIPLTAHRVRNPLIPLPMSVADLIGGIDAVLLTHYHFDHFDAEAARSLPKDLPFFCQPGDAGKLRRKGFLRVRAIDGSVEWNSLVIKRYQASHGEGFPLKALMGKSSSYFIQAKAESLFITGDAVFDPSLERSLREAQPGLILANFGAARFLWGKPITLAADGVGRIRRLLPGCAIIAVHMDAINHCGLSKEELRRSIADSGLAGDVAIPREGEALTFGGA
jgi:L-ascorbate metabolism protein UlaG (beta-lactamase superfamily)